jgi:hypothetical protein
MWMKKRPALPEKLSGLTSAGGNIVRGLRPTQVPPTLLTRANEVIE